MSGIKKNRIDEPRSNARQLAVCILTRAEKEGAYANLLLREMLSKFRDPRERNLATALVNGVLKNKLLLDYALRRYLRNPMSSLPHEIRAILRSGAFQVLFLDKIPIPAAINESVNLTRVFRKSGGSKYSGLVNSVLRRIAETGWDFPWPDKKKQLGRYLSVRYSHPEWMVKRWLQRWGEEETEQLLKINNQPSPTVIRLNTLKITKSEFLEILKSLDLKATASERVPEAFYLDEYESLEESEIFKQGFFTVQDESSQLVAHVLGVKPGERILDVCSAPGGKATHMAQLMRNEGEILAVDIYPQKLKLIEELAARLGVGIIRTLEKDARFLGGIEETFDRVLVDAPCSGLGVIRRRADLRWQKKESEIEELAKLQLEILLQASEKVKPQGELVYSTCTIEPEENFEVIKVFRNLKPEFKSVDLIPALPFSVTEERDLQQLSKGVWQILPHRHGMDGFFIAKLKREVS
ncbi:MAG: 16S rRNA (cytosine(967)-C(5))-methyltransferase RsmB [Desulfitobacteriia bacterium]|jgi:16S rRNA (cytosine967-C5)-methyltransferase